MLWKVADWVEDNEDSGVVRFTAADNAWFELEVEGLTLVRHVLAEQEDKHETWTW